MKADSDKSLFDFFPSIISGNPKKIVVLIIIFTLIMGYFASHLEMDTREESFEPETEKGKWLNEIREDFGRTGEAIQIAFVADEGDVFTTEVMEDMLRTKETVMENEKINHTLMLTEEMPEGMNTLADTVMTADVALELENILIKQSAELSNMSLSMQNQSAMYSSMDSSLENVSALVYTSIPSVEENATKALTKMANIVSYPRSWATLEVYETEFYEIVQVMRDYPFNATEIIDLSENLIQKLEQDAFTPGADQQHFIGLLEGMKNNVMNMGTSENLTNEYLSNLQSFLRFIEISNYLPHIETDFTFDTETPSLDMTVREKKERLANMTDEDVKETVGNTIQYDPDTVNHSIENAIESLNHIEEDSDKAIHSLDSSNETLTGLINYYSKEEQNEVVESLYGYKESVLENKTMLELSRPMFDSMRDGINSARFLPKLIDQLGGAITRTVSKDFIESNPEIADIRAESTIALIQMNISLSRDLRREAQKEIITISEDNSFSSTPRVFAQQVMMEEIENSANRSLNTLLPIAFIFVVIVLFIVYRTAVETVLSLLSLVFAIIWTFGFGVLFGYEFNPMIIAVPILITGLVIDYGIHMVMRYREEKEKGEKNSLSTKIAISTVGGALLLTSLTTAIGFLSNTFSNLTAMVQFGVLAAVGITASFVLMVSFLPAVIQLIENWRDKRSIESKNNSSRGIARKEGGLISSLLSTSTDASDRHPWIVLFVVILITLSGIYGLVNIDTTFDMQDFLPEDSSQGQNIRYIGANFDISTSYVYIMSEGDLSDPEYLRAVDKTIENAKDSEMVRAEEGTTSPLTVLRDYGMAVEGSANYNQTIVEAFMDSDISGDRIPDQNISYLYDLLYSNERSRRAIRNVLYRDADDSYNKGIIRFRENAQMITADLDNAKVMEEELYEDSTSLRESGYSTKITSGSIIGQQTTEELTNTQRNSLIATIIIVAVLLTIVFYYVHGSKVLGIITTLPVAMVTIWIVGTMYLMGVSLNVMTVSITALTVGMGIDYSIHITHRFTEEMAEEDNLFDAMHDTVQNTGAALFGSAATTVGAFGILATSDILPLSQFGYITALAIAYSFLVAVFVLPSALMVWAKCCKDDENGKV